jgi:hypothetical protein
MAALNQKASTPMRPSVKTTCHYLNAPLETVFAPILPLDEKMQHANRTPIT